MYITKQTVIQAKGADIMLMNYLIGEQEYFVMYKSGNYFVVDDYNVCYYNGGYEECLGFLEQAHIGYLERG